VSAWNDDFLQDLRFVFRTLRRNPSFVAISVLSLALGLGLNVSFVNYVNALFIRPLPGVPDSDRLISVYHRTDTSSFSSSSYPEYEYYRDHNRSFTGMLAYLRVPLIIRAGDESEPVFGELVSGNYFSVLALHPALGRFFAADENAPVAVLAHQFWQGRFGSDKAIIGRSVRIGNGIFNIIGVAPPAVRGIVVDWVAPPSLWVPLTQCREAVPPFRELDVLGSWGMESYQVIGRMRHWFLSCPWVDSAAGPTSSKKSRRNLCRWDSIL
jgi:hypothetical protein